MPTKTIAHGTNAGGGEQAVVFRGTGVVMDGGENVDAETITTPVSGAFEATQEEALKRGGCYGVT